jgi:hypothetical protein
MVSGSALTASVFAQHEAQDGCKPEHAGDDAERAGADGQPTGQRAAGERQDGAASGHDDRGDADALL